MFLLINIIGLLVFLGIAVLFSRDRKHIQWKSILILVLLNVFLAWFFVYFQIGRSIVEGLAAAIAWVIQSAHTGTGFAFSSFTSGKQMDMAVSALFPILLVVHYLIFLCILIFFLKLLEELVLYLRKSHVNLNLNHSLVSK